MELFGSFGQTPTLDVNENNVDSVNENTNSQSECASIYKLKILQESSRDNIMAEYTDLSKRKREELVEEGARKYRRVLTEFSKEEVGEKLVGNGEKCVERIREIGEYAGGKVEENWIYEYGENAPSSSHKIRDGMLFQKFKIDKRMVKSGRRGRRRSKNDSAIESMRQFTWAFKRMSNSNSVPSPRKSLSRSSKERKEISYNEDDLNENGSFLEGEKASGETNEEEKLLKTEVSTNKFSRVNSQIVEMNLSKKLAKRAHRISAKDILRNVVRSREGKILKKKKAVASEGGNRGCKAKKEGKKEIVSSVGENRLSKAKKEMTDVRKVYEPKEVSKKKKNEASRSKKRKLSPVETEGTHSQKLKKMRNCNLVSEDKILPTRRFRKDGILRQLYARFPSGRRQINFSDRTMTDFDTYLFSRTTEDGSEEATKCTKGDVDRQEETENLFAYPEDLKAELETGKDKSESHDEVVNRPLKGDSSATLRLNGSFMFEQNSSGMMSPLRLVMQSPFVARYDLDPELLRDLKEEPFWEEDDVDWKSGEIPPPHILPDVVPVRWLQDGPPEEDEEDKAALERSLSLRNRSSGKMPGVLKSLQKISSDDHQVCLTCNICHREFSNNEKLVKHKKKHTQGREHIRCEVCGEQFAYLKHLYRHRKVHMDQLFYCEECGKDFVCEKNLRIHRDTHMPFFVCDLCGDNFDTRPLLVKHLEATHVEALTCNICNTVYSSLAKLTYHNRLHDTSKLYQCDVCFKTFHVQKYYCQHLKIHTNVYSHVCPVCGKAFTLRKYLAAHIVRWHKKSEEEREREKQVRSIYPCTVCGKKFQWDRRRRQHEMTHANPANRDQYQCRLCPKMFYSMGGRRQHEASHMGVFRCEFCDRVFGSAAKLVVHIDFEDNDKFRCDVCQETFHSLCLLRSHEQQHPPEECQVCGKTFLKRKLYLKHLPCSGSLPFTCSVCGKTFSRKDNMQVHEKKHLLGTFQCLTCENVFDSKEELEEHGNHCESQTTDYSLLVEDD